MSHNNEKLITCVLVLFRLIAAPSLQYKQYMFYFLLK